MRRRQEDPGWGEEGSEAPARVYMAGEVKDKTGSGEVKEGRAVEL
jgi:hypothetical protein